MDGADAFDGVGGRIDFAQLQLEMKELCSVFHSQCLKWQYSHFWGIFSSYMDVHFVFPYVILSILSFLPYEPVSPCFQTDEQAGGNME
jgi:hypothetical protein